jgi:tripartite-type tricarboxylate transporter receptor subunit TctC
MAVMTFTGKVNDSTIKPRENDRKHRAVNSDEASDNSNIITTSRRSLMKLTRTFALALSSLALIGSVAAQTFPSKPVTLMVPYPPGGVSDVIARLVSQPLAANLKQTVLVDNLGGASGSIAAQKVLDAPADGHLVFQGSPNELILAGLASKAVKFKSEDFRMVQFIADAPLVIIARKGLEANSADELVALARRAAASGKSLSYASVGVGSFYHLLGDQMSKKINAPMLHVPYKGFGDIVKDLLGEQVDIMISPYAAPHIAMHNTGKIKFIGAVSAKRQPTIPNVPSVDEGTQLKGFHHSIWTGYFVKKDTPEPVVEVLHKALSETLGDVKLRTALESQSAIVPAPLSLADASKKYTAGIADFRAIAKSMNLEPQ